jgi:hypothetical protein
MPGKSKRKQQRYATKKQSMAGQAPVITNATTATPVTKTGTVFTGKTPTPSVKAAAPGSKAAAAQYTPALLKHVGAELKISVALSASILVVIIVLAFILH